MANPEHLAILKKGVEVWNRWRLENPNDEPDFSRVVLREFDFSKASLELANFRDADLISSAFVDTPLSCADFTNANLSGALFMNAELDGATFHNTTLKLTNFYRADLTSALILDCKLNKANLKRATLSHAIIGQSDFSKTVWGETVCANIDLSLLRGLESAVHEGPSVIGIDCIIKSRKKIPESFLLGAGVPKQFINYILSAKVKTIGYNSCFISYSTKNQDFADRLHADFQNNNVRCWLATEDLKIGDKFRTRIEESIRMHDKLLLVLSETSVASPWVESEVESAMERERREQRLVLFPVRLDDAVMETNVAWAADIRRTRHIGDFRDWKHHDSYTKAFDRLLRDLKAETTKTRNTRG